MCTTQRIPWVTALKAELLLLNVVLDLSAENSTSSPANKCLS